MFLLFIYINMIAFGRKLFKNTEKLNKMPQRSFSCTVMRLDFRQFQAWHQTPLSAQISYCGRNVFSIPMAMVLFHARKKFSKMGTPLSKTPIFQFLGQIPKWLDLRPLQMLLTSFDIIKSQQAFFVQPTHQNCSQLNNDGDKRNFENERFRSAALYDPKIK